MEVKKGKLYYIKKIGDTKNQIKEQSFLSEFYGFMFNDSIVIDMRVILIKDAYDYFATSFVKSFYVNTPDSENDKLILPSAFDTKVELDLSQVKYNDIMIATMNSIYLLREVTNVN